MFTTPQWIVLLIIALLGHVMALIWYLAARNKWRLSERIIYDLPIGEEQIRREFWNSLHAPMHAVVLAGFLYAGFFTNTSILSFVLTGFATAFWAEVWHYFSHRLFHVRQLHWIHAEHHRSHINSWLTAISFSFTEKLVFDIGLLGLLALADLVVPLNFYGVAAWYVAYLIINSFGHANFELKSDNFNRFLGKFITSTTYHSLHHSRYTGNYGLGTRFLDRLFKTEWEDYEPLYDRICKERKPLRQLRERVAGSGR